MNNLIRIDEFAAIAGIAVSTARSYRHFGLYGFPPPDHTVGTVMFWKRAKATAWSRRRKKRIAS